MRGGVGEASLRLSVVIPFLNEVEAAGPLLLEVRSVLEGLAGANAHLAAGPQSEAMPRQEPEPPAGSGLRREPERPAGSESRIPTYETVAVDDGSTDGTGALLESLAAEWPALRVVHHDRPRGQSAALARGFIQARGDLIATLDGDGQSDPGDIPRLLADLGDFDMITGIRGRRLDGFVRRASSRIAYRVRDAVLHDGIVDTGCSTRLFRRACLQYLPLQYRGMHRFLPALFQISGYRVKQVPVGHRPRLGGRTKYGIGNRMIPGLLDLCAVRWMKSRYAPPQVCGEDSSGPRA